MMVNGDPEALAADVLVLGSGGAGLMAAISAKRADPGLAVVLSTKGLFGKSGCTRMVQGGFNVVLREDDSFERHASDTMRGGHWLNKPELVEALVHDAPVVIEELERIMGVYFHRDDQGRLHQKGLAGQTFDRTVHHGDLTGIEIVSRLSEYAWRVGVQVLEETRGIDLLMADGAAVGAVLLNLRTGSFYAVRAPVTVLATGGSAPVYEVSSASLEKSGDGFGMAYRAGARFVDMEMAQFHPTGLLAPGSRLNGSVIAEELRGLGGRLFNAEGDRFMARYDPARMERSTRDEVARASFMEIAAGRGTEHGGVWLDVSHLGATAVEAKFPGMYDRCQMVGRDLRREPIEVAPTSHFHMGGVEIDAACRSSVPGLLVAGEDAGGVHGANRLGGNGVADATVFGRRAGLTAAVDARTHRVPLPPDPSAAVRRAMRFFTQDGRERAPTLRIELKQLMTRDVGVVRDEVGLDEATGCLRKFSMRVDRVRIAGGAQFNLGWQEAINLDNVIATGQMIAACARRREESRGAHYRGDFPTERDDPWLCNLICWQSTEGPQVEVRPLSLREVDAMRSAATP